MKSTVLSAFVVTFSLVGDTLLYPVLPSYASVLGVPVIWIGILLSVNRFARLLLNPWAASLFQRRNSGKLMLAAAMLAVFSTLLYGLAEHIAIWFVARLIWAVSFAILRLGSMYYALAPKKAGFHLGLSKGIQEAGPLLAVTAGPLCLNFMTVQSTFQLCAAITLLAVLLALLLPDLVVVPGKSTASFRLTPTVFNALIFLIAFSGDGLLVVCIGKLLENGEQSLTEIAAMAAFYLMIRRLLAAVLSPAAGALADRLGIRQVFLGAVLLKLAGCTLLLAGWIVPALLVVFTATGFALSLAPAGIPGEPDELFRKVAVTANWRDSGAAFGALAGGMLYHTPFVYQALAVLMALQFVTALHYGFIAKTTNFKSIRWK